MKDDDRKQFIDMDARILVRAIREEDTLSEGQATRIIREREATARASAFAEAAKTLDDMKADGLLSLRRNARFPYKDYPADLSDCLVVRPKPWRIEIMEPLPVEAPGPDQAEPYCCYIQTVKFYKRPLRSSTGGECDLWDECETRLSWDDVVQFESDAFVIGGGSVVWADGRWWMRRNARRLEGPLPAAPPQARAALNNGEEE